MTYEFFMPMIPPTVTAQQKGMRVVAGKPRYFDSADVSRAKAKLRAHLAKFVNRPFAEGVPLRLVTKWIWPEDEKHRAGYRHIRPDCDNLVKLMIDEMSKLHFWHNDAQIASLIIEKFYGSPPGIWVQVQVLPQLLSEVPD